MNNESIGPGSQDNTYEHVDTGADMVPAQELAMEVAMMKE